MPGFSFLDGEESSDSAENTIRKQYEQVGSASIYLDDETCAVAEIFFVFSPPRFQLPTPASRTSCSSLHEALQSALGTSEI
jgi:hypothetical protein